MSNHHLILQTFIIHRFHIHISDLSYSVYLLFTTMSTATMEGQAPPQYNPQAPMQHQPQYQQAPQQYAPQPQYQQSPQQYAPQYQQQQMAPANYGPGVQPVYLPPQQQHMQMAPIINNVMAPAAAPSSTNNVITVNAGGGGGGGCSNGHDISSSFTCCGFAWAVFCFPIGLICCLTQRQRRCRKCGGQF